MNAECGMTNFERLSGRLWTCGRLIKCRSTQFTRRSFVFRTSHFGLRSFTLIELLVVLTLLSLLASVTVVRLDGFSDDARLRSAAAQIEAAIALARMQAQTSGVPRRILCASEPPRIRIQKPQFREPYWEWDEGIEFNWSKEVALEAVLFPSEPTAHDTQGGWSSVIRGDGRLSEHAVILSMHGRRIVVFARPLETSTLFLDRSGGTLSWTSLTALLEKHRASP